MPYSTSVNLVIILNGVGLPARILPGFIADRFTGVLNLFVPILFVNCIMLFCWLAVHTSGQFYAWTVLYGIAAGAFQSLFPTAITSLGDDITKTGTRIGMAFSTIAFAALVGGPIGGAIVSHNHDEYWGATVWAACTTVLGMSLIAAARVKKFGWTTKVKC